MTPIFVLATAVSSLTGARQELIAAAAAAGAGVVVSPATEDPESELEHWTADVERPLDLQQGLAQRISKLDRPCYVAIHPSVEPATVSLRVPTIWFEPDPHPLPVSRAIALAGRAILVVAGADLAKTYGVSSDRFADISSFDPSHLSGVDTSAWRPDRSPVLHHVLSAETFRRTEAARELAARLEGLSPYRAIRMERRLGLAGGDNPVGVECLRRGDRIGAWISAVTGDVDTAGLFDELESGDPPPEPIGLLATLARVDNLSELLDLPALGRLDTLPSGTVELIIRAALRLLDGSPGRVIPDGRLRTLFAHPRLVDALDLESIESLALNLDLMPDHILERAVEYGRGYTPSFARIELERKKLERGEKVDRAMVERVISEVDELSWHPTLWREGLRIWEQIAGAPWSAEDGYEAPSVPIPPPDLSPQVLDSTARKAMADGNLLEAIEAFQSLRATCLSQTPPLETTELAARLNIGWALWKLGQPRETWAPYAGSALAEVSPDAALVSLRTRSARLVAELDAMATDGARKAQFLRAALEQQAGSGDPSELSVLEQIITEADGYTKHLALWLSGLRYWWKMTEKEWSGSPVDQAPNMLPIGEEKPNQPGIARIDKKARRALARGRHGKAALLFESVRSLSAHHDPPLTTTEQAARLNAGWAYWKQGKAALEWRPYITSVLAEVGPGPELAAVRAQAVEMLGRPSSSGIRLGKR